MKMQTNDLLKHGGLDTASAVGAEVYAPCKERSSLCFDTPYRAVSAPLDHRKLAET